MGGGGGGGGDKYQVMAQGSVSKIPIPSPVTPERNWARKECAGDTTSILYMYIHVRLRAHEGSVSKIPVPTEG